MARASIMSPSDDVRGTGRSGNAPGNNDQWQAVLARDFNSDGKFVFAVSSTGIYCRPSCPSRRPRRENVSFFRTPDAAEKSGYRACLRCRPKAIGPNRQIEMVKAICRYIEQHLDEPITLARLGSEFRQSPFHLQRSFKAALGISPREYADSCRLNQLKANLQAGHSVTRAMYDAGYSSSSRLYERTASQLGMTPDKYRRGAIAAPIRYTVADSPLGRMLIAATDKGICAIQFADSDDELEARTPPRVPLCRSAPGRRWLADLETESASPDQRPTPEHISSTRYSGHGFSTSRLDLSAIHSGGCDSFLRASRTGHRTANCHSRGSSCLRHQPGGGGDSVPPRRAHGWRNGRLPLGVRS